MSTKTWLRDVQQLLDRLGVQYRSLPTRRHVKFLIEKDGIRGTLIVSTSCSDWRALRNVETDVKRQLGLAPYTQVG